MDCYDFYMYGLFRYLRYYYFFVEFFKSLGLDGGGKYNSSSLSRKRNYVNREIYIWFKRYFSRFVVNGGRLGNNIGSYRL